MTCAPAFLKAPIDSLKAWASAVQPLVNALGKKYRTTGPFFSWSARWSLNSLPPTAPVVVKSGAAVPTLSAAPAGAAASVEATMAMRSLRIGDLLAGCEPLHEIAYSRSAESASETGRLALGAWRE